MTFKLNSIGRKEGRKVGRPSILVCPGLGGFPGHWTFSDKTVTVPGEWGWWVTLAALDWGFGRSRELLVQVDESGHPCEKKESTTFSIPTASPQRLRRILS